MIDECLSVRIGHENIPMFASGLYFFSFLFLIKITKLIISCQLREHRHIHVYFGIQRSNWSGFEILNFPWQEEKVSKHSHADLRLVANKHTSFRLDIIRYTDE